MDGSQSSSNRIEEQGKTMNNVMDAMLVRQMFGGESWTHAVFLAGVFLVILYRRDQIVSPYMFRISIILFVLSLILPVIFTSMLQAGTFRRGGGFMNSAEGGALMTVFMIGVGPTVFGLSVLFCVLSLLPPQNRYPAPPPPTLPHPLD
jgi:hypothetical protein